MKQYMPMKPIKSNIKVLVLANSTNGYFSRIEMYTDVQQGEIGTQFRLPVQMAPCLF